MPLPLGRSSRLRVQPVPFPPAAESALDPDRADLAVFCHAGLDAHLHRVPAAVGVEDLLAVERDLHGPLGPHGEQPRGELVAKWIALPAERTTVRRCDDAYP